MRILVTRRFKFEAAHHLPNYAGKCSNIHGHTWTIELALGGKLSETSGMVLDFTNIKARFGDYIDKNYDHKDLNSIIDNPTAENIAIELYRTAEQMFKNYIVYFVRVWESPDSYAEAFQEV